MPLPEILRRRSSSKQPVMPSSTPADKESRSPLKRPQKLPLEDFDLKVPVETLPHTDSGLYLVANIDDILERNVSLGYFMQYLDTVGSGSLMKFWLDVTSFRAASFSVKECTMVSLYN